jgi:hypothetical protein
LCLCGWQPFSHHGRSFIKLNNRELDRFTPTERRSIAVHAGPGGDRDSTHSADVDYAALIPDLFEQNVGLFYLQMASEFAAVTKAAPRRVAGIVAILLLLTAAAPVMACLTGAVMNHDTRHAL